MIARRALSASWHHRRTVFALAVFLTGCGKKLEGVTEWTGDQTNACALEGASGRVYCWGGRFGKGSAVRIVGIDDAVELSQGTSFFLVRTRAGALLAFDGSDHDVAGGHDPREGRVVLVSVEGHGVTSIGRGEDGLGQRFVVARSSASGSTAELRYVDFSSVPPGPPHVTVRTDGNVPSPTARRVGSAVLDEGALVVPDGTIGGGPDERFPGRTFVDRTGRGSREVFLSDETGAVFRCAGAAGAQPLVEIRELNGATSVLETNDLRCAVFGIELRCSGNRRARTGKTAAGSPTWSLVPVDLGQPIREVGAGRTWLGGVGAPSMVGPGHADPKARAEGASGYVLAITTSGAVLQWGDSDYGAIGGRDGFVDTPWAVSMRRF